MEGFNHNLTTSCQVEFGVNADVLHFLSKRGEEQAAAVGSFSAEIDTLVSRTIEDTMVNVKQYHSHRSVPPHYQVSTTAKGQYHHTTRSVPPPSHQFSTTTLPPGQSHHSITSSVGPHPHHVSPTTIPPVQSHHPITSTGLPQ